MYRKLNNMIIYALLFFSFSMAYNAYGEESDEPSEIVREYLTALHKGDYEHAYSLISSETAFDSSLSFNILATFISV